MKEQVLKLQIDVLCGGDGGWDDGTEKWEVKKDMVQEEDERRISETSRWKDRKERKKRENKMQWVRNQVLLHSVFFTSHEKFSDVPG